VRANPTQLEQVIINLAVNARDAMPRGGTLRIETSNKVLDSPAAAPMKAGSYAVLSISDTGVGMTPEVRARILEPFFTTKNRGRSTGLGLTVVANIVAESGGHLAVDSREGCGTSFTIYMPTAERLAEQPAQSMPLITSSIPRGAESVLVVEDEKNVREFVRAALTGHGYRVIDVDSAEAALAIVDRDGAKIDLLLIDIKLPGINGNELATRVSCRRPHTPVIFMTGCLDLMKGENEGSDSGILEKPFTVGALLSRTRAALDHRDHTKKPHHSLHIAESSLLPAVLAGWSRSDGPLKSESQFRARRGLSQAF
jgi:CheY-like chemotaxis protein